MDVMLVEICPGGVLQVVDGGGEGGGGCVGQAEGRS